jgi:hypothetical protein
VVESKWWKIQSQSIDMTNFQSLSTTGKKWQIIDKIQSIQSAYQ